MHVTQRHSAAIPLCPSVVNKQIADCTTELMERALTFQKPAVMQHAPGNINRLRIQLLVVRRNTELTRINYRVFVSEDMRAVSG